MGQEPPVRIGKSTVRDPDTAILRPPVVGERTIFEAENVLLIAEVCDSTLTNDRGSKQAGYANAGIPHYWIVDLKNRRLEIMSDPKCNVYKTREYAGFGEAVAVPGTKASIR